eukprot:6452403-Pyramimonas_sp.AAC.1
MNGHPGHALSERPRVSASASQRCTSRRKTTIHSPNAITALVIRRLLRHVAPQKTFRNIQRDSGIHIPRWT